MDDVDTYRAAKLLIDQHGGCCTRGCLQPTCQPNLMSDRPDTLWRMTIGRFTPAASKRRFEAFATSVERYGAVQRAYVLALCLIYLMWNIWLARTVFDFVVMPLSLFMVRRSDLKPILLSPIFLLAVAYLGLITLSGLLIDDGQPLLVLKHLENSLQVLAFLAITALLMRRDATFADLLFLFLGIAAALAALINLAAYVSVYPHGLLRDQLYGIPGVSMYYNPNVLGDVYAIATAGCFALLAQGGLPPRRLAIILLASVILLCALALIMSRGALLATTLAAGTAIMLLGNRRPPAFILAALLSGVAIVCLTTPIPEMLLRRADAFRLSLWPVYLKLAAERPWLGYGLTFDTRIVLPNGLEILNAHNVFLSALIRGGIPAAAALVALVVLSLHGAVRGWRNGHGLFAPVLLAATLGAVDVDYEILATPLGWPWLILWLPVGLSLGAMSMVSRPIQVPARGATPARQAAGGDPAITI